MDKISKQQTHFNNISEQYFKARQNKNCLKIKELLWSNFFFRKEYLLKCSSVLEPMCGFSDGKEILEKYLILKDFEYSGFDYSSKIIEYAKIKNPKLNIEVKNILDFNDENKYDLIIIIGGLHHVYDYTGQVIDKIYTSLNKNGYFINFEPTNNFYLIEWIRKKIYKSNNLFDEETESDYKLSVLNNYYTNSGFKIIDQIYPGLLSYILYYNPDAFPILNIGSTFLVNIIFKFDQLFFRNIIGKKFSFATLSILKK